MSDPKHMTRMQRFWSKLALESGKRAGLVAAVTILVTVVLGYGLTKLQFTTGQDSYLNTDDQVYIDNVEYQSLFGGQAMLVLFTLDDGVSLTDFVVQNHAEIDLANAKLSDRPDLVDAVVTPNTILQWSNSLIQSPDGDPTQSVAGQALLTAIGADQTDASKALRTADSAATLQRLGAIPPEKQQLFEPEWVDFLLYDNAGGIRKAQLSFFTDERHAQMLVRLPGNASIEKEGEGADLVKQVMSEANIKGATVTVTGSPVLLKEINDYLVGGMLKLGGIAFVVMTLILIIMFHVRWRLLPLLVIAVGVTWAFGLAGYIGIPLSLVTIAGLPIMLGIGIDYAIQMHARVEEEVLIDRDPHPIQETARNLGPALLVVTFDAVFAFLALRFAKTPMIREFGSLLSVGIAVICLTSILLPLAFLGIREYRSPTKGKDYREGALAHLTVKLGSLPIKVAPVFAVLSLAIFFAGISVEDKIELQSDPVQWVNQSGEGIRDFREMEDETGSSSELAIYVQSDDVFSQDTIDFVIDFSDELLSRYPDDLLTASSLPTTVQYLIDVPGADPVHPTSTDVQAAYDVAPPDIQVSTVNPEAGALNLVFRYGAGSLQDRKVTVDEIKASVSPPPGVEATPSGLAIVGVGLLDNLLSNRVLLTYLAIIFVGLFLMIRLHSVVRSLLSLVPVLIAVGGTSIVAWALDLKLSPMTAVGGPLVVAACTEFTSLILLRFIEERRRALPPDQAVHVAAARTGRAFIVSACTAISGVAVIATSSLPLLRDFGIIVGMNVAVALLSALVVLPPLLIWADQRGWVSKRMIPDDILRATTPKLRGAKAEVPATAPAGSESGSQSGSEPGSEGSKS